MLEVVTRLAILVVDDEKNIRHTLRVCLEAMDADVTEAGSAQAALEAIGRGAFDIVFLDLRLGTQSGLDLIPQLLAENPNVVVIVVTAYATVETAVEAIRRGAWDYLPKPFTPAQLTDITRQVSERRALERRVAGIRDIAGEGEVVVLASASPLMRWAPCLISSTSPSSTSRNSSRSRSTSNLSSRWRSCARKRGLISSSFLAKTAACCMIFPAYQNERASAPSKEPRDRRCGSCPDSERGVAQRISSIAR